jgi:hypothetical protein
VFRLDQLRGGFLLYMRQGKAVSNVLWVLARDYYNGCVGTPLPDRCAPLSSNARIDQSDPHTHTRLDLDSGGTRDTGWLLGAG